MGPESFVVVVGSGAAGTACSRTLAEAGVRVAVVENDKVGGTCLWHGCMPKKALYNSAKAYLESASAEEFGADCSARSLDWETVLAWKWHAQETYAGDPEADLARRGIEVVRGTARFEAPLKLRVDGRLLEATDVVLACGSAPVIPPIPGAETADTSLEALHYPCPPASLAIVGGGYIAFEFAGIYAAFGTQVTMLVRDRLLRGYDPEIVDVARRRLEAMGVAFRLGAHVSGIACSAEGARVTLESGEALDAQRVLLATGRRSRVAELDPAAAGLELDDRGRLVLDPLGRTTDAHVWAAGDARGDGMHTPLANAEGHHVAEAMLGHATEPLDVSTLSTAAFTFPQLAQVGITEQQAADAGIAHQVRRKSLDGIGAAVIADQRDGLVKVVTADDGVILGAQIAAPEASDLVYTYALALRGRLRLKDVQETPAVHPAYAQALEWAAW
jgi:pyruvate/2-oxoglutarate dehydrogenase complex dihydrolipoamide dehydrogenase (E3) component